MQGSAGTLSGVMSGEHIRPSGLVLHGRSFDLEPNGNLPDGPPTVGPEFDELAGDPNGVEIMSIEGDSGAGAFYPTPAPWAGWPADWAMPGWNGQLDSLVDTAWSCFDLNSSILGSMPVYTTWGPELEITDNPTWAGNPDPDLYASWFEFFRDLAWDYQGGEAFVLCTARYSDGYPARFHVVEPWMVNVEWVAGFREYKIGAEDVTGDILHIRYKGKRSDARGHGALEAGRARVVAAAVLCRYATELARGGGVPQVAIKHPQRLNRTQAEELKAEWWRARTSSLGLPAVLSGGIELETFSVNPRDMALLELSQFNESRIAILCGVPPFLQGLPSGGDSMTYSNVSSLFDYHWRAGLRPKATALMSALSWWALPRGTNVELDRDEYVRPGLEELAAWYRAMIELEVMTPAEIRKRERIGGPPPRPRPQPQQLAPAAPTTQEVAPGA